MIFNTNDQLFYFYEKSIYSYDPVPGVIPYDGLHPLAKGRLRDTTVS